MSRVFFVSQMSFDINDGKPMAKMGRPGRPSKKNKNLPEEEESQDSITAAIGGFGLQSPRAAVSRQGSKTSIASTGSKGSFKSVGSTGSKKSDKSNKSNKSRKSCGALPDVEMIEYDIAGYTVEDPKTKKRLALRETIFLYKKNMKFNKDMQQGEAVAKKLAAIKARYSKLKLYRFSTTVMLPKHLGPTLVGGLSYKFVGMTLSKLLARLPSRDN